MMSLLRWSELSYRLLRMLLFWMSFTSIVTLGKVHYHVVKSDSWLPYQQQSSSSWDDVDSTEHQSYDPSIHYAHLDVHLFGKHGKGGRIVLPISHEIVEASNQLSLQQSEVEMNFLLQKITSMKSQIKQHKIIDMENAFLLEKVAQQNAKLQAIKLLPFGIESNKRSSLKTVDFGLEGTTANVQCSHICLPSTTIADISASSALSTVAEEDHTALRMQIQSLQQTLTEAQQMQSQQAVTITKLEPQIITLQKQLEESEQDRQAVVLEEHRLRLLLQDGMERMNKSSSSPGREEDNEGDNQMQISLIVEELRTENEALKQRITVADALIKRQKEDYIAVQQRLSDKEDLIVAMHSDNKRDDMIQSFAQVKAEEALEAMKGKIRELTKNLREQEQQLHQQYQQEQKMKSKIKDLTKKLKDQQQQQQQHKLEQQKWQQQVEEQQQQRLTPPINTASMPRTAVPEQELKDADEDSGKTVGIDASGTKDSHDLEEGLEFDWNLLQGWMYICACIAMAHLVITVVINTAVYTLSLLERVGEQDMTGSTESLQQATTEKHSLEQKLISVSKAREDAAIALHQAVKDKQMIQQQCTSAIKERDFLCKNNGVLQARLTTVEGELKTEQEQSKSATAAAMKEHEDLVIVQSQLASVEDQLKAVQEEHKSATAAAMKEHTELLAVQSQLASVDAELKAEQEQSKSTAAAAMKEHTELLALQSHLASVEAELKAEQEQHKSATAAAMKEYTELMARHALLTQKSEELQFASKEENDALSGQIVTVQQELQLIVAAHSESKKENEELHRQLAMVQEDLQLVVDARTDMEKLLTDTQCQLTTLQSGKEDLLMEKEELQVMKTTLEIEKERLELVKSTLETQIGGLEDDLVTAKNEAKVILAKSEVLQTDHSSMEKTVMELRQQLKESLAYTEVLQKDQDSLETTTSELKQQLDQAKIEANDAFTKSEVMQKEQASLESTVADLQQLLIAAERVSHELTVKVEKDQASFAATIAKSEVMIATLQQQLEETAALAKTSKKELTTMQTHLVSVEGELKAEHERSKMLLSDQVSLKTTVVELRQQLKEGQVRTEMLQNDQESLETTITNLQEQLNVTKIENDQLMARSSADVKSSDATIVSLRQQLKDAEEFSEASKRELMTMQNRLTAVEGELKTEQGQSKSATAATMKEHTELLALQSQLASVEAELKAEQEQSKSATAAATKEHEELLALQSQLASVEDQLNEKETAAVMVLAEKEQLLMRQGQLVQEVDDLRLRCELTEQLLVQLQATRSSKDGTGSSSLISSPDRSNIHTTGVHDASLTMGASITSINGNNKIIMSESKSEPYLPPAIVTDIIINGITEPTGNRNDHSHPSLEPSLHEEEGDLTVGHGDKDHLKKHRKHQLALSQAALSIRVTELEGQIRKDQGRFQDMVNERKRVMALNESLERIVSRLREDSEADRHTKEDQCEQLTSELHRKEEEYANAQQVWMRRVAQLERTLTSEGEHIKMILRQRDQLAVRKAGLEARVESLDTQVRRGKESMRAYQQERLRLLEMYGESEARLHELLSLFEEMLLQGNGGENGGGSGGGSGRGSSRVVGGSGSRMTKSLTGTGTKGSSASSSPSSSKSPVKTQPSDDNNVDNHDDNHHGNNDDNDNEHDVDTLNDSRDSKRGRNATSPSTSTPMSSSTSRHVGGSSWVNRTVIETERRDAETRMSAVRALLGLDENEQRQGLVDEGQGLDEQGQGLNNERRQFRELLEIGTERYAQHDESTPIDDNNDNDKTTTENHQNDNDMDMNKSRGSKEGEGKKKGRGGVSQWMDATVQSKTNFMSCLIELEDRRTDRQGLGPVSAGLDAGRESRGGSGSESRGGFGVGSGVGSGQSGSSRAPHRSPPRRSPALINPRNRPRNVSVQAGTVALTSGLRVDHIPHPSNEHLDHIEHHRDDEGEGEGEGGKEDGYDLDMDSINASADVFDHSSIYLDHDHGTCTSPQMLSGSLFDETTEEGYLDDGIVRFASPSFILGAHLIATPSHSLNSSNNNHTNNSNTNNSINHANNSSIASSSGKGSVSSTLSIPPPRPNPNRTTSLSPAPANTRRGIFPSPATHTTSSVKTKRHIITPNQPTK